MTAKTGLIGIMAAPELKKKRNFGTNLKLPTITPSASGQFNGTDGGAAGGLTTSASPYISNLAASATGPLTGSSHGSGHSSLLGAGGEGMASASLQQEVSAVMGDIKFELDANDFDILSELGNGAGGTVHKVLHRPTGVIMARKVPPHPSLMV